MKTSESPGELSNTIGLCHGIQFQLFQLRSSEESCLSHGELLKLLRRILVSLSRCCKIAAYSQHFDIGQNIASQLLN